MGSADLTLEAGLTLKGDFQNWWSNFTGRVAPDSDAVSVNPLAQLRRDLQCPAAIDESMAAELTGRFSDRLPVLWVTDPDTLVTLPYWPREFSIPRIERLLAGELKPHELTDRERTTFLAIRLLVDDRRTSPNRLGVQTVADQAGETAYVIINGLLNPYILQGLGTYVRTLDSNGAMVNGDRQTRLRNVVHNEEVAQFIHRQLAPLVCRLTHSDIKPSYCYLCVYKEGATLPRHVDRQQCAWNISLVLEMQPLCGSDDSWPLFLEVDGQARPVRLGPGDAVLYRGKDVPHWREELPRGATYTACLFHFVRTDFNGTLD